MKFYLGTLLLLVLESPSTNAYSVFSSHPALVSTCENGSCASSFTASNRMARHESSRRNYRNKGNDMLMYDSRSDPPNGKGKDGNSGGRIPSTDGVFMALAKTESWISSTLEKSNRSAGPTGQMPEGNPYVRKEVSYVCETSDEVATIVAGIFRRLREARETGEMHGRIQEAQIMEKGPEYSPGTLRQTNVVVIPSSDELKSWHDYDNLIQVINQARRNSRDYVINSAMDKDSSEREWVVSVNCAHLHPNYGEKTSKEIMEEMKKEEEEGEVDMHLKEYKERRLQARRSPYPTLVLEVRALPPPDFGESTPPPPAEAMQQEEEVDGKVTSDDIKKLEALFGKSVALDHPASSKDQDEDDDDDDDFYARIGMSMGINEISIVSPFQQAQVWVSENDPRFDASTSTFTETDVEHVDAAYEFVFSNIAMHCTENRPVDNDLPESSAGSRSYLVMPNYLPSSATSFEKFSGEVTKMLDAMPGFEGKVKVSTMHPEHVDSRKRSPVPIFVLKWSENWDDEF